MRGNGLRRVAVHGHELGGRHRPNRVDLRLQRPQRLQSPRCRLGILLERRLDRHEGTPAQRLGQLGQGRVPQHTHQRGDRLGDVRHPLTPRVRDLGGPVDGPQKTTGDHLGERVELQLHRGDDHGRDSPARGPEEVAVVIVVDPHGSAQRIDGLDRADAGRGQAVRPGEPAESTAQHQAGRSH